MMSSVSGEAHSDPHLLFCADNSVKRSSGSSPESRVKTPLLAEKRRHTLS